MRGLICVVAGSIFFTVLFGCSACASAPPPKPNEMQPKVWLSEKSSADLYVCGYPTDREKEELELHCVTMERFMETYKQELEEQQKEFDKTSPKHHL